MPTEETPSVETQAEATPTPQAGNPSEVPTPESPAESESISLDEAKKLRSEAANLRKRLKAFEEAEAKKTEADLSETERERKARETAEQERDEARNEARSIRIDNAITLAVDDTKLNARDPASLADLIRRDALDIVDGKVVGIEAELKRLKTERPAQFYSSTADGGAQSTGTQSTSAGLGTLQSAYANSQPRR